MHAAAARGARLVVFPEMFLTGYMVSNQLPEMALDVSGGELGEVRATAAQLRLVTVVGLPEIMTDGPPYNSACVIDADGSVAGVHRKVHMFQGDAEVFTPGAGFTAFRTAIGRLGVAICYDIEFPESARELVLGGADLIVVPTANMEPYDEVQDFIVRSRAWENGVNIVLANQSGQDAFFTYFGGSSVVDGWGNVLARAGREHGLITANVNMGSPPAHRARYLSRRQPGAYRRISSIPPYR
jgi:predicted amidohydrolase